MSNLPPGVTPNMIPGNRPQDVALQQAHEALDDGAHDLRLYELKEALRRLLDHTRDPDARADGAIDIVNILHELSEAEGGLARWVDGIEDLGAVLS